MAWTRTDGWVWVFAVVDHYTAEAWAHVAKIGDRFAALQPVYDAVIDRWGRLDADVARGLSLRHDWGPQYRSLVDPSLRSHRLRRGRMRLLVEPPVRVGRPPIPLVSLRTSTRSAAPDGPGRSDRH
jgi:hypothetical protein